MDQLPLTCLLVVGFEGDAVRIQEQMALATELAVQATGKELGPGPGEHWFKHRYAVAFKLPKVFMQGAFAETVEVAGLWRDVARIYHNVRNGVMGKVLLMAHFSHAYREGCSIYFTMSGYSKSPKGLLDKYDLTIRAILSRAMKAGATVSHHHGIGLMKRAFMEDEYRGGERIFWAAKQALDPACVLNPDKIYPSSVPFPAKPQAQEGGDLLDFHSVVYWEHQSRGVKEITPEVPEEIPEILRLAHDAGRVICCQDTMNATREACRGDRVSHMDLSRLDQILELDPVSGTVTAQAGITMRQLDNYLCEKGLSLGLVPKSKRAWLLGDYLASTGPCEGSPLYGTLRENCIGLSAVLPDGSVFSARPCPRRAAGPDLMSCFLGAQGCYGIITAACLRVFPLPAVSETLVYGIVDAELSVSAIRSILLKQSAPEWVIVGVRGGTNGGDGYRRARMVFQFGGTREAVSADMAVVRAVMTEVGATQEATRADDRGNGGAKHPSIERFLPWRDIEEILRRLSNDTTSATPDALITDVTPQGAMLRLVCRDEAQTCPEDLAVLLATVLDPVLAAAALRLKEALDPNHVLNCKLVGDDENGEGG